MKVAVWDTYVRRADGLTMHFDILVPDTVQDAQKVYGYGDDYLGTKPFEAETVTTRQCRYCHGDRHPRNGAGHRREGLLHPGDGELRPLRHPKASARGALAPGCDETWEPARVSFPRLQP